MRRRKKLFPDRLTCAWCRKPLADDAEVFAISVKVRPEYYHLAKAQAGQIIDFPLLTTGKDVPAIVAGVDSDAKKAGKDLIFPACSPACGKALEATLAHERSLVDPKVE